MKLALFFSKKVSLKTWDETGIFDREIALYEKHADKGIDTLFITYDKAIDSSIAERIPNINILYNRFHLSSDSYHFFCPILHAKALEKVDIIKTNQISGSLAAINASRLFKKPLVARCGYMHSEFSILKNGAESRKTRRILANEHRLFSRANAIIVTTKSMAESIINRLPEVEARITVIPNYVDTELFMPKNQPKEYDIIFIGRFSEQKNLPALLDAITRLNLKALIIGNGSNAQSLREQFPSEKIEWLGNISNSLLPDYINKAKVFVLPSHFEGHPKTLIEAMACGAAVTGTDAPGIREVIAHNKTGFLTKNDTESLSNTIRILLDKPELMTRLGREARRFALENYSLNTLAEKEYRILRKVIQNY